jgi:hypothetical protein
MRTFRAVLVMLASTLLLSSCAILPLGRTDCYYSDSRCTQLSRDRVAQIVDALNSQDSAALKEMFTDYALAEYSAEIDDGVAYLLSLFPRGDVVWHEPEAAPRVSKWNNHGQHTALARSGYLVTSGGNEYSLFFVVFEENENDPDNVGVYGMGAALRTDSENSNLEAAFRPWALSFDVHADSPPGVFMADSGQSSRDRAARIVDALNGQDVAALREIFTEYALAAYSAEIDDGLEYLLSLFPNGVTVLQEDPGGSAVYKRFDGEASTVLMSSFYRLSSGEVEFRLFFAEFTENAIMPDNIGIYAIGAVPIVGALNEGPEAGIYDWTGSFDVGANSPPGIYIPE